MGYLFRIGEPELNYDSGSPKLMIFEHVEKEAPVGARGALGNSNALGALFQDWEDFSRAVGLYPLFYNTNNGFLHKHPNCVSFGPKELDRVQLALKEWQEGLSSMREAFPDAMARLQWLAWWMRWALLHCKAPSFYNC